jgi:hypothetical protein
MRKAVVALLFYFAACQPVTAQTTAWADKLFAGDLIHDFGTVPRGAQLKYTFKMTNIYRVPLEITNIRVECGCVTVKEGTKLLQPNESGWLNVNMDSARFSGQKSVKIFVSVGPEYISTATLSVHANARADVVFNPGEIDFGLVHHGQASAKFIDVEYAGSFPWAVSEIVKNSSAPFELKVEDLKSRATRGYRITAVMKQDAPAGTFKEEVLLKTNDPTTPTLTFNVLGNVQATLSVQPEVLTLAAVKVGDTEKKRVLVRGSRPFRILGIDGQGDGVTAAALKEGAASENQFVEVRFSPARAGELRKRLSIRTDLDNEAVTLTVQGTGT